MKISSSLLVLLLGALLPQPAFTQKSIQQAIRDTMDAIAKENVEDVGKMLNTPYVHPNDTIPDGSTLLEYAIRMHLSNVRNGKPNGEVIYYLIKRGADPMFVNNRSNGRTSPQSYCYIQTQVQSLPVETQGEWFEALTSVCHSLVQRIIHDSKNITAYRPLDGDKAHYSAALRDILDGGFGPFNAPNLYYEIMFAPNDKECVWAVTQYLDDGASPNPDFNDASHTKNAIDATRFKGYTACGNYLASKGSPAP